MARKTRLFINPSATSELLAGGATRRVVGRVASRMRDECGMEFDVRVRVGKRVRGYVVAGSPKARARQAKHHLLERAVGTVTGGSS
jgi:hypothetical protein|nr:MAG TPA: hypothetical protein [Caudoviricetes sp.]